MSLRSNLITPSLCESTKRQSSVYFEEVKKAHKSEYDHVLDTFSFL